MPKNTRSQGMGSNWPVALALLAVLPVVGGVLYWKSLHYDPGLYALEIKGEAKAPAAAPADQANEALAAVVPDDLAALGWKKSGDASFYTPENLYVKIDGFADSYLAYGFQRLMTLPLALAADAAFEAEIFIYDMGDRTGAFGKYSEERDSYADPAEIGEEGYISGGSAFFWKDRFYVQVNISEEGAAAESACAALAAAMAERISGEEDGQPIPYLGDFPEENKKPRSGRYMKQDVFGLEFMTDMFLATYQPGDEEIDLFVRKEGQERPASEIFEELAGFLEENGENFYIQEMGESRRVGATVYDTPVIAVLKGDSLKGAWGGSSMDEAAQTLDALIQVGAEDQ